MRFPPPAPPAGGHGSLTLEVFSVYELLSSIMSFPIGLYIFDFDSIINYLPYYINIYIWGFEIHSSKPH